MHVLLVSGWTKQDFGWRWYRKWWEAEGVTTSCNQSKAMNFGPIQAAAKQLARQIDDQKYPPILVGHSMGGLIIKYCIGKYQPEVAGIVTIASPLYGSSLAKLAPWSYSASQMVPENGFLRQMEVLPEPDCPVLSVYCSHDVVVSQESAVWHLEDSEVFVSEVPHTHMSVLASKKTWNMINDFAMECIEGDVDLELMDIDQYNEEVDGDE